MRKTKWGRRLGITAAVVALVAALIWMSMPRERLLLKIAHPTSLKIDRYMPGLDAWYDDHTVLKLQKVKGTDHWGLLLHDMNTGQNRPYPGLDDGVASLLKSFVVKDSRSRKLSHFDVLNTRQAVSPDRKWLLWKMADGTPNGYRMLAIPLGEGVKESSEGGAKPANSGISIRQWPLDRTWFYYPPWLFWMPDSRRWVTVTRDKRLEIDGIVIHDMAHPDQVTTRKAAKSGGIWAVAITPDGHLWTVLKIAAQNAANVPQRTNFTYFDMDIESAHPTTRQIDIPLPRGTVARDMYPAPDGKHLLLHVVGTTQPPGPNWVQALLTRFHIMRPQIQEGLWICRPDGSDMQEVGHLTSPTNSQSSQIRLQLMQQRSLMAGYLVGIEWLSDSEHIRFGYQNKLYLIGVPSQ